MVEGLTSDAIASTIRLLRDEFSGAVLVVEGGTDATFFRRLVNNDCQIIPAHGKEKALKVIEMLDSEDFRGVIAIVDADCWHVENIHPSSTNILLTDSHDVETMILTSPALDKVLGEFSSQQKVSTFREKNNKDVRTAILDVGMPIGCIRWASLRLNFALDFEGLSFSKFISARENLAIDVERLVTIVLSRSGARVTATDLRTLAEELTNMVHDPWQICCGHDLVHILSIGLRSLFGTNDASKVSPDTLEKVLRLAYEPSYFQVTELFDAIVIWQQETGYLVLA